MPEFILNTRGACGMPGAVGIFAKDGVYTWRELHPFTRGYIEALFFTETEPGTTRADRAADPEAWAADVREGRRHDLPGDYGFSDLSAEAFAACVADCEAFRQTPAWRALVEALGNEELGDLESDLAALANGSPDVKAGRDFLYTRNGHGCGFADDWPEPHATALSEAAERFGEVSAYVDAAGLVGLS